MKDIKLQIQCFALLGKTRKQIQNWMLYGDKSPGAIDAMKLRLQQIIQDVDRYLDDLNDEDSDI